MAWKTLSLHFKQTYEGGYRYLDRCGEFMLAAEEQLDLIPGDVKPTGAKMEIPEQGVNLACDAKDLAVSQELPSGDEAYFINLSKAAAQLVSEHFQPQAVIRNGFAWKSYWAFATVKETLAASLTIGGTFHAELQKVVGMIPDHKRLDYMFASGSKDFHVVLQPVTFERPQIPTQNPTLHANRLEKNRIDRFNQFAVRTNGRLSYALLLELDLMENDPPQTASLDKHFDELRQKNEMLRKQFFLK